VNKSQLGHEYLSNSRPWNDRGNFSRYNIQAVMRRLNDPQDSIPMVHIAGTNGKGSVSAAISSILAQSGYKVGMNISPHLEKINERIVIDGTSCSDEFIGEFAYEIKQAAHREQVDLSFHEVITALAFLGLREAGVDWGVIEVGLGGRLDASNVISRPAVTAIVTISFDHQHILGNSLAEIASEKAGIIKAGVPLITGMVPIEADRVISNSARAVPHYKFGRDYDARPLESSGYNRFEYWGKDFFPGSSSSFEFESALPGQHQGHNLAVAATMGLVVGCSKAACKRGIEEVFWPGRLEIISHKSGELVLDCAHNPAGIETFISFLKARAAQNIDLTFGVLDTKNWREMVRMLRPYVGSWRIIAPESERALPLEALKQEITVSGTGINVECYGKDYERCLRDLFEVAERGVAYVTGSMYMVGRLRNMLSIPERPIWKRRIQANDVL